MNEIEIALCIALIVACIAIVWLIRMVHHLRIAVRGHQAALQGMHETCSHLHNMVCELAQLVVPTMRGSTAPSDGPAPGRRQWRDLPPGGKIQ